MDTRKHGNGGIGAILVMNIFLPVEQKHNRFELLQREKANFRHGFFLAWWHHEYLFG